MSVELSKPVLEFLALSASMRSSQTVLTEELVGVTPIMVTSHHSEWEALYGTDECGHPRNPLPAAPNGWNWWAIGEKNIMCLCQQPLRDSVYNVIDFSNESWIVISTYNFEGVKPIHRFGLPRSLLRKP